VHAALATITVRGQQVGPAADLREVVGPLLGRTLLFAGRRNQVALFSANRLALRKCQADIAHTRTLARPWWLRAKSVLKHFREEGFDSRYFRAARAPAKRATVSKCTRATALLRTLASKAHQECC
jgi:hypothetical protein